MSTYSSIRYIFGYSCLLLGWMIPDHIPPWNTFYQEAATAIGIILLWPWQGLQNFPFRFYIASFIFIATTTVQYFLSTIDFGDFIFAILVALIFCMTATIGSNSKKLYYKPEKFYFIILVAALANTVIGLAQWLDVTQGIWMLDSPSRRVYGNFAQPNHFSTLLNLGIASLIYFESKNYLKGFFLYTAAFILTFGIVASESRTGALSLTAITFIVLITRNQGNIGNSLKWLAPNFILFWLFYFFWGSISNFLNTNATRTGVGLSSSSRFELWRQMVEAIQLAPWTGYGWLQIGRAQNLVASYIGGTSNMDHAHNIFLDVILWFGIPLGTVFFIFCLLWIFQIVGKIKSEKDSPEVLLYAITLIPIAIHSQLEYPFSYVYFIVVFAYFSGAIEQRITINRYFSKKFGLFINIIVLSGILLGLGIINDYKKIEDDFRAVRLERNFFTKEENRHIFNTNLFILTQYGHLIESLRIENFSEKTKKSVDFVKNVTLRFPWLLTYQNYYALLVAQGYCDEADKQKEIIESLFGRYGILKIQETIEQQNLSKFCHTTEED